MPLSSFHDFHKLTNNSGQFPDALVPAAQAQFKYQYEIDLTNQLEFSTGDLLTVNVTVTFDVRDAGGNLLLEVVLAASYLAGQDIFGFTEYVTRQSVTATPAVPTLGDPNGNIVPGDGGAGAASGADIIFDQFLTPVFVLPIPAGATVKITHHTAQYPALDDIEGLQVATRPGGGWVSGFRHSADGEAQLLFSAGSAAQTARTTGRTRTLTQSLPLTEWGADGPGALLRGALGGRVLAVYPSEGTVYARWSVSDGASFGDAMTLYANMTLLDAVAQSGGTLIFMQDKTGAAFTGVLDRSGKASPALPSVLPAGVKLSPGRLVTSGAGLDFFWTSNVGLERIHSDNDGMTWTSPPAPASPATT